MVFARQFGCRLLSCIMAMAFVIISAQAALAYDSSAKQAILIDADTKMVLYQKDARSQMPTSSMSKVMTMYMVFEALRDGRLTLDQKLPVSEKAWRKGGSKMFVEVGSEVSVEDLIRGVIIQSGNDATIVLAEGLSGSEEAFAQLMTEKAHEIGMTDSNFVNASGWPDVNHYSTAHDLGILAYNLIKNFPEYYSYYSEEEFTYNGIRQSNRNPLLYRNVGADGIKTGHTNVAGYGLIGSAEQNGRRLIFVVNGLDSERARAQEGVALLQWGFRSFKKRDLFEKGNQIGQAQVWLGQQKTVPVVVNEDVSVLFKISDRDNVTAELELREPFPAPIREGMEMGRLKITSGDFPPITYPVYAAQNVEQVGIVGRVTERFKHLLLSQF